MKAKQTVLALTLAALAAGTTGVQAQPIRRVAYTPSTTVADGRLVDVNVLIGGSQVPLFWAPGRGDRLYFQAFKGRNYSLMLRNNTGERIGVLIAVDGLNVVNGEMSSLGHDEPMYVLDPWESATIQGWRTSLESVRRFVFVDEERSYAERSGQSNSDMGWIRVTAFREQRPIAWRYRRYDVPQPGNERDDQLGRREAEEGKGAQAPEAGSKDQAGGELQKSGPTPVEPNMAFDQRSNGDEQRSFPGTGWGDRRRDVVQQVQFLAAAQATDQLVLRYEYASGLRALGIIPQTRPWRLWEREGQLGFAQSPRW